MASGNGRIRPKYAICTNNSTARPHLHPWLCFSMVNQLVQPQMDRKPDIYVDIRIPNESKIVVDFKSGSGILSNDFDCKIF